MAFAIFWLVIGDLITYHQEHVFGISLFDNQTPFTLPKGKDDGKTANFKSAKDDNHLAYTYIAFSDFYIGGQDQLIGTPKNVCRFYFPPFIAVANSHNKNSIPLRAPPAHS